MSEERQFNFNVTETEANGILGALGELPAKVSMGLITKLQGQAQSQLAPGTVAESAPASPQLLTENQ